MSAASAACDAVIALRSRRREVLSLQERYGVPEARAAAV
jgi:hypothetical protein